MGNISNTNKLTTKRLNIMEKILDKIDYELDLISPSNSIDQSKKVCENIITLANTFNVLDLWLVEPNSDNNVKE